MDVARDDSEIRPKQLQSRVLEHWPEWGGDSSSDRVAPLPKQSIESKIRSLPRVPRQFFDFDVLAQRMVTAVKQPTQNAFRAAHAWTSQKPQLTFV